MEGLGDGHHRSEPLKEVTFKVSEVSNLKMTAQISWKKIVNTQNSE